MTQPSSMCDEIDKITKRVITDSAFIMMCSGYALQHQQVSRSTDAEQQCSISEYMLGCSISEYMMGCSSLAQLCVHTMSYQ